MTMLPHRILQAGFVAALLASGPAIAQRGVPPTTVLVGGYAMSSDRDLFDNLQHSSEHTVFVGLLRAAGMVDGLQAHGPFTVLAPTDAAFAALPAGMLDALRRPERRADLVALLSMQILEGNYSSARLRYLIRSGKGQVELETVSNGKLVAEANGPSNLLLRDGKNDLADLVIDDVKQSNGVLFVTDRVLLPG